jgi:hypothetical protein
MRFFKKQISDNQLNLGLQSRDLSSFVDLICLSFNFLPSLTTNKSFPTLFFETGKSSVT